MPVRPKPKSTKRRTTQKALRSDILAVVAWYAQNGGGCYGSDTIYQLGRLLLSKSPNQTVLPLDEVREKYRKELMKLGF